jgi:alpha-ketoglutaric semialdehyde dehydrogenase
MGSTNPVILLPDAVRTMPDKIADAMSASITMGVGQFCTNPGLIFCLDDKDTDYLLGKISAGISKSLPAKMLHQGIADNYHSRRKSILENQNVAILSVSETEAKSNEGYPTIATVSGIEFASNPKLHEEIFGPFSLVVRFATIDEMTNTLLTIEGQLSGTIWATETDLESNKVLLDILENKVGRLVINGAPTGVEVCPSIVHGGPFPATTDPRFTSVGTSAIKRFVRPVCYQNLPDKFLPNELQNSNPENIWRLVNNDWTKKSSE